MPVDDPFQPFQATSSLVGTISQWEDGKGCGWVKSGSKRLFLHIKEFDRIPRRPQLGDDIRFVQGVDPKGRDCAMHVTFVKSGGRVGIGGWVLLSGLLVLPGLAAIMLPVPLWVTPAVMVIVSAITCWMYADDKQRAVATRWRVQESSLHLAELLGGWPGAFLAQRRLRHKCSKASYQMAFWTIVLLYQIVAADILLDHRLGRMLMDSVAPLIRRVEPVKSGQDENPNQHGIRKLGPHQ